MHQHARSAGLLLPPPVLTCSRFTAGVRSRRWLMVLLRLESCEARFASSTACMQHARTHICAHVCAYMRLHTCVNICIQHCLHAARTSSILHKRTHALYSTGHSTWGVILLCL